MTSSTDASEKIPAPVGQTGQRIGPGLFALSRDGLLWAAVCAVFVISFPLAEAFPWLLRIEEGRGLPIPEWFDAAMNGFVSVFKRPFRAVSWAMELPVYGLREFYVWAPWPLVILFVVFLGYLAVGWRLALFCFLVLSYTLLAGYWEKAALTVALVSVALPLALAAGLSIGVLAHNRAYTRRFIESMLDFMQTIPAFAYLIPCLILFGFGPTVGLIASAVFATPPMARNVMLGLSRVPMEVIESATMSGATERQLLWRVKIPCAMPTLLIGLNQTILATLSMVVIAAVLGSGEDLGWEVLDKMRRADFGQSLLAGVAIVLIAMVMDRITQGFARGQAEPGASAWRHLRNRTGLILAGALIALTLTAYAAIPAFRELHRMDGIISYQVLDDAITWINTNYPDVTTQIKNVTLFYFMLPFKIGLDDVIRPFSWGFELTPTLIFAYSAIVAVAAGSVGVKFGWRLGLATAFLGTVIYFGLTDMPWPAIVLPVTVVAWRIGGWRIGLFAFLAMAFMLATGLWFRSMLSVYLCTSAVLLCAIFGFGLGIWAALSDRFSAFIRPVNDTLQSIPLFVFLIPVVGLFKVGEFAGLLAIIMYAIVPVIRYTEHGIRQVRHEVIEAARVMGCTKLQLLMYVQLPLALPAIMLGINQTILFGLAMLVVTALIGTKGLGQVIYQSLSIGGFGLGITAGLSMAFIAMIADRIIQTWSQKKKREYGLT